MFKKDMSRLVLLSGPSCTGKGPLIRAVEKFYPNIKFHKSSVIKSLESRPGGKLRPDDNPEDFRAAGEIKNWAGNPKYIVGSCRGLPQAVNLDCIQKASENTRLLYLEAYYSLGQQVRDSNYLKGLPGLEITTIFLSPLSKDEIEALQTAGIDISPFLTNLMMNKLLTRARVMGKKLSDDFINDCFSRAWNTYNELNKAYFFTGVLVNHDGEGSANWHYDPIQKDFSGRPEGDAARTLESFAAILAEEEPKFDEKWPPDLFKKASQVRDIATLIELGERTSRLMHELKGSSLGLRNVLESLIEHPESIESWLQNLKKINERIWQTISNVGKLVSKKEIEKIEVNLVNLLEEIKTSPQISSRLKDIDLIVSGTCRPILGSKEDLMEAFIYLIENAIEAIPGNNQGGGNISVKIQEVEDEVSICVRDNGCGIPPTRLPKILSPYYTTKKQGSGMGLPLARKIIEQLHGGSLRLESQVGVGTTITILLPREPSH